MKIRRSIPDYVDGIERITVEFNTKEELLSIPWIKAFEQTLNGKKFHQFSICTDAPDRCILMAEHDEGRRWWVVGFINAPTLDFLPKWEPNEDKEE